MGINIGDGVVRILGDTTPVDRKIAGIGQKAKTAGTQAARGLKPMNAALRGIMKLAGAVGAAFLAWKAVSIFRSMVKAASNFQREMNRVKALTGATGRSFEQLSEQAKKLGRTTQFSASEAAAGMAFLAQAGFSANEIVKAMPDTLNLAAAAQITLAEAADIVSNVMSGMGVAVEDLGETVDILTKAFTSANTDLRQLGDAMKYAGPVASDFGLSIAEATGALSLLGNAGIQASMAGTSLRNILNRLVRDGEKFGINIFDSTGKMKSFAEIIAAVDKAALSAQERIKLFGDRAGPAMSVFLRMGSKAIGEFIGKLDDHGIASRVAQIQMEGLAGATKRLESAWEGLQIAIADEAMLNRLASLADATSRFLGRLIWSTAELQRFNEELAKREEQEGWLARMLSWGTIVDKNAIETEGWVDSTIGLEAAMRKLNQAVQENIELRYHKLEADLAEGADKTGEAVRGLGIDFDAATGSVARFRGENERLIEQFEQAAFKQHLEELNRGLGDIALNLELATEGIGAFIEPTEEQLAALGEAVKENTTNFVDLGQQAVLAFAQMAGASKGAGGVMLRVMAMVASQILNEIALRQTEVAATAAAEVGKAGVTLKALKQLALVQAVIQTAKGFAALGSMNFWKAAQHFAAAALFGSVGAMQVMAIVGAIGGRRGAGGRAPGAGAEGAAPVRGQVAGATAGGGEPLEVVRGMAMGGLITRPTLAMLGERAPAIKEAVIPLPPGVGGVGGPQTIEQHFNITIEGLVSPDNLDDVIQQISERVRSSDIGLEASKSYRVTEKS